MKSKVLQAVVIATCMVSYAHAEEREWISYKDLIENTHLDKFYHAAPNQRDKLRLLLKLTPENKTISPSNVVLTVVYSGGRERLPLTPDGLLDIVPNSTWLKEDAKIMTSLPKSEKSRISAMMAVRTPDASQLPYAELMGAVPQWNALIKEQAGVLRFMLPKFNALDIHFSKGSRASVQVMAKDGTKTFTADASGELKIKLNEAWMQENPSVVLTEKPNLVEVDEL